MPEIKRRILPRVFDVPTLIGELRETLGQMIEAQRETNKLLREAAAERRAERERGDDGG